MEVPENIRVGNTTPHVVSVEDLLTLILADDQMADRDKILMLTNVARIANDMPPYQDSSKAVEDTVVFGDHPSASNEDEVLVNDDAADGQAVSNEDEVLVNDDAADGQAVSNEDEVLVNDDAADGQAASNEDGSSRLPDPKLDFREYIMALEASMTDAPQPGVHDDDSHIEQACLVKKLGDMSNIVAYMSSPDAVINRRNLTWIVSIINRHIEITKVSIDPFPEKLTVGSTTCNLLKAIIVSNHTEFISESPTNFEGKHIQEHVGRPLPLLDFIDSWYKSEPMVSKVKIRSENDFASMIFILESIKNEWDQTGNTECQYEECCRSCGFYHALGSSKKRVFCRHQNCNREDCKFAHRPGQNIADVNVVYDNQGWVPFNLDMALNYQMPDRETIRVNMCHFIRCGNPNCRFAHNPGQNLYGLNVIEARPVQRLPRGVNPQSIEARDFYRSQESTV